MQRFSIQFLLTNGTMVRKNYSPNFEELYYLLQVVTFILSLMIVFGKVLFFINNKVREVTVLTNIIQGVFLDLRRDLTLNLSLVM